MQYKSMIVCRCEEVSYDELVEVASANNCSARELKLRTRAGMGYCGGRTCRTMVDQIAHKHHPRPDSEISLKYQAPIRPVRFADLGEVK
ncbi:MULTISPECIES: (2Fe-2S)-binding protein [Lysinibacillus]|uniref:(2Fe-2S)-binding protein n=1 Tax=Lysinibacillus xylanilyticus TaxID=582475 RepID=A0ABV3W2X9_9BACI